MPRWLEERAGYKVGELGSRDRLGLDLDTPQDIALVALARSAPGWLRKAATANRLEIPRLQNIRELAADPHRELLVFGRSSSATLRWLEQNVRARVRFLAEERGLRASSPLAIGGAVDRPTRLRGPRATLGLLLDERGPGALSEIVVNSRRRRDHRFASVAGAPARRGRDRLAATERPVRQRLLRSDQISDPWLKALTESANGRTPILLGGHSLVGPGSRWYAGKSRRG